MVLPTGGVKYPARTLAFGFGRMFSQSGSRGRVETMAERAKNGGVQSVGRVLDLLEIVGDAGGEIGLSELAARSGLPLPSIHRLVRTLVDRGYMRQLPNRRYALGARLIPLGQVAGTMLGTWARPVLAELVDGLGETANLAVLDGDA